MIKSINKILTSAVIILFIAISLAPAINSESNSIKDEKNCDVEITEYKSDGTINKVTISLTKDELNDLKKDLFTAETQEQKLTILKQKGLVPQNIELENLEKGMYKKAERLGISNDIGSHNIKIRLPILFTLFTLVDTFYFGGASLSIGLSPLMRFINQILPIKIPGIDVIDLAGGFFGVTFTRGLFYRQTLLTFGGFTSMVGFVGYSFKVPASIHLFLGFSVATIGLGLGFKLKEWVF
jgi:hypothetical protein